jgi:hypothetical protein
MPFFQRDCKKELRHLIKITTDYVQPARPVWNRGIGLGAEVAELDTKPPEVAHIQQVL